MSSDLNIISLWKTLNKPEIALFSKILKDTLGISTKIYEEEGLYVFNYSQCDSPKSNPIVMECRGLITDAAFNIVCKPFTRFFNLNEHESDSETFDFRRAYCFEKADGSLVKVYHWNGSWRIATRGTAFAETECHHGYSTYSSLILETFGVNSLEDLDEILSKYLDERLTYLFELVSPMNRVVTPYQNGIMVLLGVGNSYVSPETLKVVADNLSVLGCLNVRAAKTYNFSNMDDVVAASQQLEDLEEGYVCWDTVNDIRVKIKSPKYLTAHYLRGDNPNSAKKICNIIYNGEVDEYLSYFKEDTEKFQKYIATIKSIEDEVDTVYNEYTDIVNDKAFAEAIKDYHDIKSILFLARRYGVTARESFHKLKGTYKTKLIVKRLGEKL